MTAILTRCWKEKKNVIFKSLIIRYASPLITLLFCAILELAFSVTWFLARLYESTGRAIAVTTASASALASALALALASAFFKMLKFLVKVFMTLYLLKLWMDQVDTLHVGRYWSEVLCCTIMTHLGDLEVKVTDLEILCLSFWLKFL